MSGSIRKIKVKVKKFKPIDIHPSSVQCSSEMRIVTDGVLKSPDTSPIKTEEDNKQGGSPLKSKFRPKPKKPKFVEPLAYLVASQSTDHNVLCSCCMNTFIESSTLSTSTEDSDKQDAKSAKKKSKIETKSDLQLELKSVQPSTASISGTTKPIDSSPAETEDPSKQGSSYAKKFFDPNRFRYWIHLNHFFNCIISTCKAYKRFRDHMLEFARINSHDIIIISGNRQIKTYHEGLMSILCQKLINCSICMEFLRHFTCIGRSCDCNSRQDTYKVNKYVTDYIERAPVKGKQYGNLTRTEMQEVHGYLANDFNKTIKSHIKKLLPSIQFNKKEIQSDVAENESESREKPLKPDNHTSSTKSEQQLEINAEGDLEVEAESDIFIVLDTSPDPEDKQAMNEAFSVESTLPLQDESETNSDSSYEKLEQISSSTDESSIEKPPLNATTNAEIKHKSDALSESENLVELISTYLTKFRKQLFIEAGEQDVEKVLLDSSKFTKSKKRKDFMHTQKIVNTLNELMDLAVCVHSSLELFISSNPLDKSNGERYVWECRSTSFLFSFPTSVLQRSRGHPSNCSMCKLEIDQIRPQPVHGLIIPDFCKVERPKGSYRKVEPKAVKDKNLEKKRMRNICTCKVNLTTKQVRILQDSYKAPSDNDGNISRKAGNKKKRRFGSDVYVGLAGILDADLVHVDNQDNRYIKKDWLRNRRSTQLDLKTVTDHLEFKNELHSDENWEIALHKRLNQIFPPTDASKRIKLFEPILWVQPNSFYQVA